MQLIKLVFHEIESNQTGTKKRQNLIVIFMRMGAA
jgi:hypothetical protein